MFKKFKKLCLLLVSQTGLAGETGIKWLFITLWK